MGCDIHPYVEARTDGGEWQYLPDVDVFDCRDYSLFGFLADVRNYSDSPVIAEPRGLPDDVTAKIREAADWDNYHSRTWFTLAELQEYDYEQRFDDCREPYGVPDTTLRAFLGEWYFAELDRLAKIPGEVRIVLWFDN